MPKGYRKDGTKMIPPSGLGRKMPPRSKEHSEKIALALRGKHPSEETRRKLSESLRGNKNSLGKGHPQSKETREKISKSHLGVKKSPLTEEHKRKLSEAERGVPKSPEHNRKNSEAQKRRVAEGRHPWYKGGITPINTKIRHSLEYKLWHKSVFERDNYTCIWCGKRGGTLNADHIKPFFLFPELRFAIDNGRTLCVDCHKKTDSYGSKGYWENKKLVE